MNNEEHQTSYAYLFWPLAVLLVLAIGVFFTTKQQFYPQAQILPIDNSLSISFLLLFVLAFITGILFFFKKLN